MDSTGNARTPSVATFASSAAGTMPPPDTGPQLIARAGIPCCRAITAQSSRKWLPAAYTACPLAPHNDTMLENATKKSSPRS